MTASWLAVLLAANNPTPSLSVSADARCERSLLDVLFAEPDRLSPAVSFTVNDGTKAVTLGYSLLSLLGNPSTPQVTNFARAQAIDHTADFALRFNASGNTLLDLVQVIITEAVGRDQGRPVR